MKHNSTPHIIQDVRHGLNTLRLLLWVVVDNILGFSIGANAEDIDSYYNVE